MTTDAPPQIDSETTRVPRVASVDTMRGLTILLMVFVNDLGPAAPAWMHHIQPPDADGMTLADVVFLVRLARNAVLDGAVSCGGMFAADVRGRFSCGQPGHSH
jgi:hypothetical protein